MENQLQFKELLSKSLINPFGHPYVIIDKDMGILAVNGSPKAPVFTSPPQHGVDLDQILHPYIKGRCSKLLKQAIKGANQTTDIQLTDGYFCRMQLLEVPSSENGQAFICFFETHNRKALPGTDVYLSKPISSWSNGHPKSDNIYHKVKCTEARLKENEQLLISINENLNEGIYRSTPKNGFIYVNKAFARMFGLTVEEAININPEKLYANESDRNRVTNTLVTKGHLKNEQVEFLKRDGTTFWGFLSSIRTKDANGQLIFDGAIVDISDLKRSKVLLHEKNDELKKINAELDRFVYSASHDLRAPLTSLLGLVNVTMLENNNHKLNGYLEMMKDSVNKLDDLISDIIHFFRNARLDVTPEPVHFECLAQETFDNLKYLPTAGSIETNVQIEPYKNFFSEPKRLRILFNNLVSNAFRYHDLSKEMPFIKIQINFEQNYAVIKVSDNGKGVHPEHLDSIFEMFYRATDDSQGSGLGLYIVKETVEKLQGTVQVQSVPGKGTTFILRIPNLEVN